VAKGFEIVASFPRFRSLPIILSESDPEGCAACSARLYPQNAYRNGTLYPCYAAAALSSVLTLAERQGINLEGMLTWAFEFEGQPYFDGFRTLATNGVDKPVLNLFRMAGLMRGDRLKVVSSGAVGLVLVWNYHDDDLPGPDAPVTLAISGMPGVQRVLVRHYRIDSHHSNAYAVWKEMGSPQNPSPEQYARLEAAGNLELLNSPSWEWTEAGSAAIKFSLPRQAVSLVQLSW
jgi:xylan 1,4-beta-xylosidase